MTGDLADVDRSSFCNTAILSISCKAISDNFLDNSVNVSIFIDDGSNTFRQQPWPLGPRRRASFPLFSPRFGARYVQQTGQLLRLLTDIQLGCRAWCIDLVISLHAHRSETPLAMPRSAILLKSNDANCVSSHLLFGARRLVARKKSFTQLPAGDFQSADLQSSCKPASMKCRRGS